MEESTIINSKGLEYEGDVGVMREEVIVAVEYDVSHFASTLPPPPFSLTPLQKSRSGKLDGRSRNITPLHLLSFFLFLFFPPPPPPHRCTKGMK